MHELCYHYLTGRKTEAGLTTSWAQLELRDFTLSTGVTDLVGRPVLKDFLLTKPPLVQVTIYSLTVKSYETFMCTTDRT